MLEAVPIGEGVRHGHRQPDASLLGYFCPESLTSRR